MSENRTIQIQNRLDEINRLESFIESFCLRYRIYDEYFGIIVHSLSEIVRKIIKQNQGDGLITIMQSQKKNNVQFTISSPGQLDLELRFNEKNPTDQAVSKLVDEFRFEDNVISIIYNIQSIHYNEWIRRKNLLYEYEKEKVKRAR